jgi:hypothetical protein
MTVPDGFKAVQTEYGSKPSRSSPQGSDSAEQADIGCNEEAAN